MIRLFEVRLEITEDIDVLKGKAEKLLGCQIQKLTLVKKAIDARKISDIYYSCTVDVEPSGKLKPIKKAKYREIINNDYSFPKTIPNGKIIIVGTGPAGLFAALSLAESGYNPIVIERGADVDERVKCVNNYFSFGELDAETNIQFGEGGAGTFSDGKLNTGVNDERIKYVLKRFVEFGADESILTDAMPHIGTDILRNVVKNIRKEIIRLGGKVYFKTKLIGLNTEDGRIVGAKVSSNGNQTEIPCDALLLAIGHSGRDTYRMLYSSGMAMLQKPFSIGVRIEHKQKMISKALYGSFADKLPPAPYKLWTHLKDGSSLYTFCMCPGGFVVNAASEKNRLCTNGMSNFARESENANSALLVNVSNVDGGSVFGGMELQEKIEDLAFEAGERSYKMPVQLLGDFLNNKSKTEIGDVLPSVKPGYVLSDINEILPRQITSTIRQGILEFDKKLKGFSSYDAVITAPETRSSSPVKIVRDRESLETSIVGVYSAGEGGGHAGGITSSAVDGIKNAEAIARFLIKK